jgi:hypothetical protein
MPPIPTWLLFSAFVARFLDSQRQRGRETWQLKQGLEAMVSLFERRLAAQVDGMVSVTGVWANWHFEVNAYVERSSRQARFLGTRCTLT